MALSRNCSLCLKLGFTLALLLSLAFLPSQSVSMARKMIGSRPPGCVNKCMTCQPCKATLVISPSLKNKGPNNTDPSKRQDDTYYLLSWKCRCRDQIFQP
ncbi:EPIDERMAL PATTERNING FACTOR-like protein 8 [Lycium barbarum]|uniref:EPIDERMAL PATTERNING FACTOR-like protein 8 n=1 Tax=Lycium barbarum TaxID=112863 RepID=UPI00293EEDD8|nr:EPIDERMAL PATTERNING FACTOR-like protein 8 [Lycium barbarum]